MTRARTTRRPAFTLVELLVAVGIIVILAAILIPTIAAARRKALETRVALEVNQIDKSMEAYKLKHGDYPPNFFDIELVKRHVNKAWPQARISPAATSAAANINSFGYPNGTYEIIPGWNMPAPDAAECIVFWLDGLSTDPRFPFTGPGGPLLKTAAGQIVLNPERNEGLFTFDRGRIAIYLADSSGNPDPAGVPLSNDEVLLHGLAASASDPFPVYYPQGLALVRDPAYGDNGPPFVYFDSRSYTLTPAVAAAATGGSVTDYMRAFWTSQDQTIPGTAAPYRTDEVNPRRNPAADTATNPGNHLYYAERNRFQIISAGLDGEFGVALFSYNSGNTLDVPAVAAGYRVSLGNAGDEDNIANFSEGRSLVRQKP